MITLKINNSFSKIDGLTIDQHKELKDILSYKINPKSAFFSNRFNPKRTLLSNRGDFPTGLLHLVNDFLIKNNIDTNFVSERIVPKPTLGLYELEKSITPYPEQVKAVNVAAKAGHGTISMPTGSGKSITMALLINKLQVKTLVVVPNLELKRQLTESFTRFFGKLDNITIENIDSKTLNVYHGYDCLIIDEGHHSAARTYRKLNKKVWNKIYHRYFFTATPYRSNSEEQILLESIAGQVIYKLTYEECVKSKYIVPVEAYYYELPKKQVEGYTWSEVYKDLVVNNEYRNDLISKLMTKFYVSKISALCLVKEIEHGELLSNSTGAGFANGQDEETPTLINWFNQGKMKVLIGTVGVLGEGIDTKPAEYVIVAGLGKSKNQFMQIIGRGVRRYGEKESCKVIIFKDSSHKWTLNHFKEQCKILRQEYGIEPIRLEWKL